MKNSKSTKRTLIASIMSLVLCVTMLLGTTFAWFTDTASTGVNTIQSGNLDVEIQNESGNAITNLEWVTADNRSQNEILWEPGCTYKLQNFKIHNKGNLALKYKMSIDGIDGDDGLLKVIHFSYTKGDKTYELDQEEVLKADQTSETITISATMDTTAGNEYMNKTLEGIVVNVYATQATVEYDSTTNQYDKDAEYFIPVKSTEELKDAVDAGENVVLENDLVMTEDDALQINNNEVSIDLNGKTVSTTNSFAVVKSGTLTLTGGTVKVARANGTPSTVVKANAGGTVIIDGGTYISDYAVAQAIGGQVIINGGEFNAQESVLSPFEGGILTVNGGTFTSNDNAVIATNGTKSGSEITINGGTFNGNIQTAGYIACGVYAAGNDTVNINGGTFNITDGVGVLMRAGTITIGKDVVINLISKNTEVVSGYVGDSNNAIPVSKYLVKDIKANYPGAASAFNVINESSYELTTIE